MFAIHFRALCVVHSLWDSSTSRCLMRKIARLAASCGLLGASALPGTAVGAANASAAPSPASLCPDANIAMFGPSVCVFTPSMTQAAIQKDVNAIYAQQVGNQFGTDRY